MVYTVTLNPALDYVMSLGSLEKGTVNRSRGEEIYFGGKGLNVSAVLGELGVPSLALGFAAGFVGEEIISRAEAAGIQTDFVRLERGNSRINVKIRAEEETEINGGGPEISDAAIEELFAKMDRLHKGDTLVLAGSVPPSLPEDIYERILRRLSGRGIRFAVDAAGALLINSLGYEPFLIKPNLSELGGICGHIPQTNEEIIDCARGLQRKGAKNVLVSMDEKGSILADSEGNIHVMGALSGEAVNSVGAGDSMVAGFIAGYESSGDHRQALELGTAAGAATAFSAGLARRGEIMEQLERLRKEPNAYYCNIKS